MIQKQTPVRYGGKSCIGILNIHCGILDDVVLLSVTEINAQAMGLLYNLECGRRNGSVDARFCLALSPGF